ncbi:MAG: TetR family transcriptional regulator [Cyanobacteria bacterium P01_F01_bin.3]
MTHLVENNQRKKKTLTMIKRKVSSREKIVRSALQLFSTRGITATTTKEIAEQAGVNEVTLFRQFGSKHGLLLAVMKEAPILSAMQAELSEIVGANDPLVAYGSAGLELLGRVPELMRSLIGETSQSPLENQQALGEALKQANQQTVGYLRGEQVGRDDLSVEEVASLLNTLIVGHAVMDASSGGQTLWQQEADFLSAIKRLFISSEHASEHGLTQQVTTATSAATGEPAVTVMDLPAEVVRSLFQNAKKKGPQAYALVYVLFGAGLRVEEVLGLMRSQVFASKTQHLLNLSGPMARQVSVNRWIMGNRYGTYLKNPLTQWLKSRADDRPEVFLDESEEAMTEAGLNALWASVLEGVEPVLGGAILPFHARQTWCIELLTKGMSLENLSLLSGFSLDELAPYATRTKEKAALEQALAIDQKN